MKVDNKGSISDRQHRLVVLLDVPDESGRWDGLVREVADLIDLVPSYLTLPGAHEEWLHAVLTVAAACPAPVLVLPRTPLTPSAGDSGAGRLGKVLLASDDSAEALSGALLCSRHLVRSGITTTVVFVLTPETAPPMWEGAGHNASAWRAERVRRHGLPHQMKILRGVPGDVVRQHCARADLVVLVWHQAVEAGRAPVVRAVLDEGTTQPCLLLSTNWVEGSRQHLGGPMNVIPAAR
ncbi:MAG TPA: universal stress protein [Acidimicrobiales bacterium]|nr:universal stress protein [Acidimicrobiales bacterium]